MKWIYGISLVITALLPLPGFHTRDADESSVRVKRSDIIGAYEMKFENGSERLVLRSDGSFVQDFSSKSRPFHHTGQWRFDNVFLDGSEIVLLNAASSESDETRPLAFGEMNLYTHKRSGKLALARNEVADWWYERTPN